ncbi:MAG: Putative major facilitator superfamily transporter [Candidatus Tokpelaia hoelldobleri]|uniref:Major facilitator superfamily transporter n=1 Tax=Candidatus Tokpelaia hoelldobleri TaxID=1902579 RepID=A0A1U9JSP6_9HYPH|nr:MAG: Putative major facilitator superfamily transporter [Candidatus Tokpelaia hoelldoblerii]
MAHSPILFPTETVAEALPDHKAEQKKMFKAFFASLSGTSLEWYDFAVYGAAAAMVFNHLFFPGDDALTGTLKAFGTYAVGYVSRPLGGIFFGRLGDIVGRKKVLVWTLVLIGIATFLIGLLPGYHSVGYLAPALLVLLRFAQGIGVGGEWGGAVLLSSEFSKPEQRGFWASAAQVGPPMGNLLANGVLAALAFAFTQEQFQDWGWRVAFLLSAVLVAFGLWIRHSLEETPVFQKLEKQGARSHTPIRDIFQHESRALFSSILSRIGSDVLYAMFAVFVLAYAKQTLGMSYEQAIAAVMIASAIQVLCIPFAGWLSDKIGRRQVYAAGAFGGIASIFVFFYLMQSPDFSHLLIGVISGLFFHSLMFGPQAAFVSEQFSPHLRYTGSSLAYTFSSVVGGAIAPLLLTWFIAYDPSGLYVCLYITATAGLTLTGLAIAGPAKQDA